MRGPEWHPAFSLKDRRKSKGYKTATAFAHKIGMLGLEAGMNVARKEES